MQSEADCFILYIKKFDLFFYINVIVQISIISKTCTMLYMVY